MADNWNALSNENEDAELQAKEAVKLQAALDSVDKMMHDLVTKNKKAMDYLFTKYVIDAPLETELPDIYRNQGKIELLRWIYSRAELSQTRAENNKQ